MRAPNRSSIAIAFLLGIAIGAALFQFANAFVQSKQEVRTIRMKAFLTDFWTRNKEDITITGRGIVNIADGGQWIARYLARVEAPEFQALQPNADIESRSLFEYNPRDGAFTDLIAVDLGPLGDEEAGQGNAWMVFVMEDSTIGVTDDAMFSLEEFRVWCDRNLDERRPVGFLLWDGRIGMLMPGKAIVYDLLHSSGWWRSGGTP